ncbi:sulfite exporter TauE/SafE family protein [Azohydromonas lata]|uniref:sulfite exporter TauE/SafE family protein n=1 Tax=Azohydromonas lata TaxID=45677 RepID=UPI00082B2389|nr:sulfite exporter TauE/SafE family protein [Azohydromonas lata]
MDATPLKAAPLPLAAAQAPADDFSHSHHPDDHPELRIAMWAAASILCGLLVYLAWRLFFGEHGPAAGVQIVSDALHSPVFWSAVGVGLLAQIVDGALGMAYGVTATTFLMSTGASPAMASASVHIAEVFTTGMSGLSHAKLGNVNKSLFLRLLVPGIVGAILGAILVTQFDGKVLKPIISAYLVLMGLYILRKAWRHRGVKREQPKHVAKLALFGGFVDAAGGGGWGPVVTSNLIGAGGDPRTTIGSVNFAEFFLTLSGATAFILLAGEPGTWLTVAGLVFGGLFAAPFAALLCRSLKARTLMTIVGCLVISVSLFNIYKALG